MADGGAREDRTPDLLRAKQALSQLSYGPTARPAVVGLGGFEPPTSPLSGVRSDQLSYRPVYRGLRSATRPMAYPLGLQAKLEWTSAELCSCSFRR